MKYICKIMSETGYIHIFKDVKTYIRDVKSSVANIYGIVTAWDHYEFYFSSIANCARWLGVSYNAVKLCLRGDYSLCKGYTMEYVDEAPDERDYFIDPDKYRNPDLQFETGEKFVDSAGKKSHWTTYQR